MHTVYVAGGIAAIGLWLAAYVARHWSEGYGRTLSVLGSLVARALAYGIFAAIGVRLAGRGGWWIAPASAFFAFAALGLALMSATVWALLRSDVDSTA